METNRTVRLLRNRLYPTFQLYAVMASKKTSPQDGLKLGALMVMHWLVQRLEDHIPPELQELPEIDDYKTMPDERLPARLCRDGYLKRILDFPSTAVSWSAGFRP